MCGIRSVFAVIKKIVVGFFFFLYHSSKSCVLGNVPQHTADYVPPALNVSPFLKEKKIVIWEKWQQGIAW